MKNTHKLILIAAIAIVGTGLLLVLQPENPEPLTMVVIPAEAEVKTKQQFVPFVDYLSEGLGRPMELLTVADYAAVVEAMKYGHADIARFGPFSYVLATQEAEVEAIVTAIKKKTGEPSYHSFLIAREELQNLNGRSLAYTDVGSTSGYLVPATYIKKTGIELGDVFYAGTQGAAIEAVKNGTVDLGAVASNRYYTAIEEGVIGEEELHVVWKSEPIPNSPIAVQRDMDTELKEAVTEAFLSAPRELIEGCGVREIGYVRASDSDYDLIREVQEVLEE